MLKIELLYAQRGQVQIRTGTVAFSDVNSYRLSPSSVGRCSQPQLPAPACSGSALFTMSHALLLRLFLSPAFFSVHVALRYLMRYSDNIGITYYLTRRLREFTVEELRDVWGFIWYS